MKKTLFFLLFFCQITFAQDKYPTAFNFQWNQHPTTQPLSIDSFPQNNFQLGWQWSGGPMKFDTLMKVSSSVGNFNSTFWPSSSLTFQSCTLPIYYRVHFDNSPTGYIAATFNSAGMEFSPILKVDTTKPKIYRPTPGDPFHAAFGYAFIHDSLHILPNDTCLRVLKSAKTTWDPSGEVILAEPWPNDQFTVNHNGKGGLMCAFAESG